MRHAAVLILSLLPLACAADLFVGDDDTDTASDSTGMDESTSTTQSETTQTPTTQEPATTEDPSTTEPDTSDTNEVTTSTTEPDPTTGDDPTTGEEPTCDGQAFSGCNELAFCVWVGPQGDGECIEDPCESAAADECGQLEGEAPCSEELDCSWVPEGDGGVCLLDICAPCELQEGETCIPSPFCSYNKETMVCSEV